ncbi:NAD(P)/FAD-dependent oxidoreductase [Pseudomonadota bacterium]
MTDKPKTAIIIGAGPAGLTAAYELLQRTDIRPVIFEASDHIGGISKTVNYKNNHIDIGGHRFFSKSDRVMDWWLNILPLESKGLGEFEIKYQNKKTVVSESAQSGDGETDPEQTDQVMLVRSRKSRIYFNRTLFDYPISLSADTLVKLGIFKSMRIGFSYLRSVALPVKPERTLEDFFINRFGRELYSTFFKSYTEKVWGVGCREISAEWGAQRVKGLSISKAIWHKVKSALPGRSDIRQKNTETSLIERFLYPKYGPGQMWEVVAGLIEEQGGVLHRNTVVDGVNLGDGKIVSVTVTDVSSGERSVHPADHVFSSMPVKNLISAMSPAPDETVKQVAEGLVYRDFMTVGLLVNKMKIKDPGAATEMVSDNWIYIQEPDVKLGRLQIFNNWSPYMVADPGNVWLGLEYFCDEGDELWNSADDAMIDFAAEELARIDIIDRSDVLDGVVLREPKTYPAYFGTYDSFHVVREFVDSIPNLYLVGRNGMHRYNNQDHSMLTAMTAVENIRNGVTDKDNIWQVNTESEYLEEK